MRLAAFFAMLVPSALAQIPCQSPTQLIESSPPQTHSQFGRYGAIDGNTALVTSEDPAIGGGPLQVHVFERDPNGTWNNVQVLSLAGASSVAPAGRRVHLEGDTALVTFNCGFDVDARILQRDVVSGQWSEFQRITSFQTTCLTTAFDGDRIAMGDRLAQKVNIFERGTGGLWGLTRVIQGTGDPVFSRFGSNVALSDTTLVIVDEGMRELHFYELDAQGNFVLDAVEVKALSPSSTFGVLGRSLDIDAERLVASNMDGQASSVEIYRRQPLARPRWSREASLSSDPAGNSQGFGFYTVMTQGTAFTVVQATDCPGGGHARLVMARGPGFHPFWTSTVSVCATSYGATGFSDIKPLDYDGNTLLLGLPGEPVGPVPAAGAIAFIDVPSLDRDCDGDCTLDGDEIAACFGCDLNGNGKLDRCERRGRRYCDPSVVNSSGASGRLDVLGTASVGSTDLTAVASALPTASFGILVSAGMPALVPGAAGSAGTRCIGGSTFGRFPAHATGLGGTFQQTIDPQLMPSGPGPYALQPGDTVYFQAWFRDGGSSNFTDALAITFEG